MRFELSAPLRAALKDGAEWTAGTGHPKYRIELPVPLDMRRSLLGYLAWS
jgi:hypothetical protein